MSECGYLYVCVHGAIYARVSMHALSHTYVSVTSVLLAFYYIYTCKRICALYIHTYYVIGHVLAVYIHTVLVYMSVHIDFGAPQPASTQDTLYIHTM
jgi:small-conductance mechanosensitive channel